MIGQAGVARLHRLLAKRLPADERLANAIAGHAWTFAGSGAFSIEGRRPLTLAIAHNPLTAPERAERPVCDWHRAVFRTLFDALAGGGWQVREVACCAAGQAACRFLLTRSA